MCIRDRIYYESPYRLRKFLVEALDVFGNRHAAVCKELTKMYERVTRGRLSQLLDDLPETPKGEYVIVIAGAEYEPTDTPQGESLTHASSSRYAESRGLRTHATEVSGQ